MFGLSMWEVMIIGLAIAAIAGPAALVRLIKSVQALNRTKKELIEAVDVEKIVTDNLLGAGQSSAASERPKQEA